MMRAHSESNIFRLWGPTNVGSQAGSTISWGCTRLDTSVDDKVFWRRNEMQHSTEGAGALQANL